MNDISASGGGAWWGEAAAVRVRTVHFNSAPGQILTSKSEAKQRPEDDEAAPIAHDL